MNKKLYSQVRTLMSHGKGRRKIATHLGISERKARDYCKMVVDNGDANYATGGRPTLPALSPFKPIEPVEMIIEDWEEDIEPEHPSIDSSVPSVMSYRDNKAQRIIVLSDIHIPYEDKKALEIAIEYMIDNTPDHIVLNGDIADFYTVSSYDKYTKNRPTLQDECDAVVAFFSRLRNLFPDAKMSFLEGNHETRLRKYIQKNADAFSEMDALSLPKLFKLDEMQIDYYPPNRPLEIGKSMIITHGELARKGAGSTARGHRDKYNSSVLVGHIHRGSVAYQRVRDGQQLLVENPCLCEMDVEYGNFFDWLTGFSELRAYPDGGITAHTHAIINHKLITMDGKVYESRD